MLCVEESWAVKLKGVLGITEKQIETKQNQKTERGEPERWTECAEEGQSYC